MQRPSPLRLDSVNEDDAPKCVQFQDATPKDHLLLDASNPSSNTPSWGHAKTDPTHKWNQQQMDGRSQTASSKPLTVKTPSSKSSFRSRLLQRLGTWSLVKLMTTPKNPKTPASASSSAPGSQVRVSQSMRAPAGTSKQSKPKSVTHAARQLALRAKAAVAQTWRSYWKHPELSPPERGMQEEETSSEPSPWLWAWPEEPTAPSTVGLRALEELDVFLCKINGSIPEAFFDSPNQVTKFDLRVSLHIKQQTETNREDPSMAPKLGDKQVDELYQHLLALVRREEGPIPMPELLNFPQAVKQQREMLEKLKLSGCTAGLAEEAELIGGHQLVAVVKNGLFSKVQARELLAYLSLVLEKEPKRTLNAFLLGGSSKSRPGEGLKYVAEIIRSDSSADMEVDTILNGWAFYTSLIAHAVQLGPPLQPNAPKSSSGSNSLPEKNNISNAPKSAMKKIFANNAFAKEGKYKVKVDVAKKCKALDDVGHKKACHAALWKAFSPGQVLWAIRCGAEKLCDSKFQQLLVAAWALLDEADAVCWLLGPVGLGRLRKELCTCFDLCFRWGSAAQDPTFVHVELGDKGVLVAIQHLESLSAADSRLARTAALYGATFLLARIRSQINSLLDLTDDGFAAEQSRIDAAEVNRAIDAIISLLTPHVEDLLHERSMASQ